MKYLGIVISRSPEDYVRLNIEPLIATLKTKTQTWAKIHLGVMGRVNLIKMIILPKFLYVLWHALGYLPLRIFKSIEAILNSFVWGMNRHKLSWQVLKNPTDLGGTALPDFNLYYLAAPLSHLYYIDKHDKDRYFALVCSPYTRLYTHPFQIIFREPTDTWTLGSHGGLLYHHCKIWAVVRHRLQTPVMHSHTPLWDNPGLRELLLLPDHSLWIAQGVVYLLNVYCGILKSFQQLKEEFNLSNSMHFRYLQLRYALQAQFHDDPPNLDHLDVLCIIIGQDPLFQYSTICSFALHRQNLPTDGRIVGLVTWGGWKMKNGRMH